MRRLKKKMINILSLTFAEREDGNLSIEEYMKAYEYSDDKKEIAEKNRKKGKRVYKLLTILKLNNIVLNHYENNII